MIAESPRKPETLDEYFQVMNRWLDTFCKRDFTKRQANILFFLLSFTVHTKSLKTHIPTFKDFEQCGVAPSKVRAELEQLAKNKVIFINEEEMTFALNPNADEWAVKPFKNFNQERFDYLMDLNKILTEMNA